MYKWEGEFIHKLGNFSELLETNNLKNNESYSIWYEAGRSFGDITESSIFSDVEKLAGGIIVMTIYVQFLLSKFNWVEWRVSI